MSQKKIIIHEDKIIRARIIFFCRKKRIAYADLFPKLKFNRSAIDSQNCFIVLDLMMEVGAKISIGEYRKWTRELQFLFSQGLKLVP